MAATADLLIIQHAEAEGPGLLAPALEQAGVRATVLPIWQGARVPRAAAGIAGLVVMGGPMGVYETERFPHLADAIVLTADALRRDLPILGVCLGSQILAAAAGARVYPGTVKEIGWFPVRLNGMGRSDPVLSALPAEATVFHWHGDTFDLPPGGTLLASSERYAHQAFRLGRRAYGLQFHVEVTPEMVDRFIEAGAGEASDFGGAEGAAGMRAGARRFGPALAGHLPGMMRAFVRAGGLL
jgi:GMP synthase (glutamine-hydrolysing)